MGDVMSAPEARREAYRRAYDHIARAKDELLDALRIAEGDGLRWSASIDKLCGRVESLQAKYQELQR